MTSYTIISFVVGLLLGIIIGFYFSNKKIILFANIELKHIEKGVSIILCLVWLILHTIGFFYDMQVALMFDIVGMGAMSHLIGLDIGSLLDKYLKSGKR